SQLARRHTVVVWLMHSPYAKSRPDQTFSLQASELAQTEGTMEHPLLWHIPLSPYNEKVRWALDYKNIAHRRRVLGPDYLIRAWRATGQGKPNRCSIRLPTCAVHQSRQL